MPSTISIEIRSDVATPMSDGTILYSDLFLPAGNDPHPTILQRTPYDKASALSQQMLDPISAAKSGYSVVIQDVRGRYSSEGIFYPFFNEIRDGYDTIEWIAEQPWSTGKIGMCGASYVGATQWLAAISNPPHLTTIIPNVTASNYHNGWTYQGGAFELGFNISWTLLQLTLANLKNISVQKPDLITKRGSLINAIDHMEQTFQWPTLKTFPYLLDGLAEYFYDWVSHPDFDDYWNTINIENYHSKISIPTLNIGGWYDIFLGGTLDNYKGMKSSRSTEVDKSNQRLVVGPWQHGARGSSVVGEEYFGIASDALAFGIDSLHLKWYEYWLKGIANDIMSSSPVKIFVMGDDIWRDETTWPLSRARDTTYFLHSGGHANTKHGDGWLDTDKPVDEPNDIYLYNPNDPVPTAGGPLCCNPHFMRNGAFNQNQLEDRPDILIYSTSPLENNVEVTGHIMVYLWASTSAVDTDFTAKLIDVCEDGCARNLTDGIIRARYRNSMSNPEPVNPGEPYLYEIDLWATSNVFKVGHKIRLEISSSNFPRFDRTPNTGTVISEESTFQPAIQSILHNFTYPSHITLPIIPR